MILTVVGVMRLHVRNQMMGSMGVSDAYRSIFT